MISNNMSGYMVLFNELKIEVLKGMIWFDEDNRNNKKERDK